MRVQDVMQTEVVTIPVGMSYRDVERVLREKEITGAPVVDAAGNVVGIVSEKDLFRVLYPFYSSFYENPEMYSDLETRETKASDIADHPVERFMSSRVWHIEPDVPLMRAGAIMLARGIHRMPVITDGKLVGIVTRTAVYRAVFEMNLDRE
ncbi:MAG: CBS domain-containing protein [Candidatus Uhrbacteria bacterium]|nr:CBS domain-containing protein [Candidatus Uhrbacteria bacterium]